MGRLFCERVAQLLWSNSFTTSMSVPLGSGPCMPWTERMLFECLCCYGNTVGRTEHRVIPSACSRSIVHDRRWPRRDRSIVLTLPVRGFFFFAICRSFVQHACMMHDYSKPGPGGCFRKRPVVFRLVGPNVRSITAHLTQPCSPDADEQLRPSARHNWRFIGSQPSQQKQVEHIDITSIQNIRMPDHKPDNQHSSGSHHQKQGRATHDCCTKSLF
jgi:hypothetical protein